jgi:hypothetical protein
MYSVVQYPIQPNKIIFFQSKISYNVGKVSITGHAQICTAFQKVISGKKFEKNQKN